MPLIHRIIPAHRVESFLEEGLRFARCDSFVDVLEFRLAYCSFRAPPTSTWQDLQQCVGRSFKSERVNRTISNASISCWFGWNEGHTPKPFMWEIYGKGGGAIRISVSSDRLIAHLRLATRNSNVPGVAGSVTYGLGSSAINPPIYEHWNELTSAQDEDYDLFFYKHHFFDYEDEFRVVLFGPGPIAIRIPTGVIEFVTLSPVGPPSPEVLSLLRSRFDNKLRE
jgi:hypothetical protein